MNKIVSGAPNTGYANDGRKQMAEKMGAAPMQMKSQSMAQEQMQVMSPQLPQGSMGYGKFQSNAIQGQMDQARRFKAMQNLVSGKYQF